MSNLISKQISLRSSEKHAGNISRKIAAYHSAGKFKRAAHWTGMYLNSFDAKYVAVHRANQKLPRQRRRPKKELAEIAANLDPWKGSEEDVIVNLKFKGDTENSFRTIMNFGIENRALQYLVGSALLPQADLHTSQHAISGGRNSAIEAALNAISAGYIWIAEIDIKNFFQSLDGENLPGLLPLPRQVTRQSIASQGLSLIPGNILSHCGYDSISEWREDDIDPIAGMLIEARQGIPQGSAVSSIVAETLLAPVVAETSKIGAAVNYADNILVMARERQDAVSMIETLVAALKSHPVGPLKPHFKTSLGNHMRFDFLGYSIFNEYGNCIAKPTENHLARFSSRYSSDLVKATDPTMPLVKRKRRLKNLSRYVRSWTAAFSLWGWAKTERKQKLDKIKRTLNRI